MLPALLVPGHALSLLSPAKSCDGGTAERSWVFCPLYLPAASPVPPAWFRPRPQLTRRPRRRSYSSRRKGGGDACRNPSRVPAVRTGRARRDGFLPGPRALHAAAAAGAEASTHSAFSSPFLRKTFPSRLRGRATCRLGEQRPSSAGKGTQGTRDCLGDMKLCPCATPTNLRGTYSTLWRCRQKRSQASKRHVEKKTGLESHGR